MGACQGSCWIWSSITQRAYQAAEIIASLNKMDSSHIVPVYSFPDARGLGAYEGRLYRSYSLPAFGNWNFVLEFKMLLQFVNARTFIGAMLFTLWMPKDGQYWCFLMFLLISFYELWSFIVLLVLRIRNDDQNNKRADVLQDDPQDIDLL